MTRLLLLALVGFTLAAQDYIERPAAQAWTGIIDTLRKASAADDAKPEFEYVLIVRVWGGSYISQGGFSSVSSAWTYKAHLYENMKELREALEWNNGKRWDKDDIIGLWRLSHQATMDLSSKDVEHVEPEHVIERRWTERVWKIRRTLNERGSTPAFGDTLPVISEQK